MRISLTSRRCDRCVSLCFPFDHDPSVATVPPIEEIGNPRQRQDGPIDIKKELSASLGFLHFSPIGRHRFAGEENGIEKIFGDTFGTDACQEPKPRLEKNSAQWIGRVSSHLARPTRRLLGTAARAKAVIGGRLSLVAGN